MGLISKVAPILAPNFVDEIVRYYSVGLSSSKEIADGNCLNAADENNTGNLERAIKTAEELTEQGYNITFDVLGEEAKSAIEAQTFKSYFYEAFELMRKASLISKGEVERRREESKLNPYSHCASFSFKPSAFFTRYEDFFHEFTALGQREGFSTTIDMEDVEWLLPTISLYRKMLAQFDNAGTVLQTNVDLSEEMIDDIINIENTRLRICIGIYKVSKKHGTMDKIVRKERLKSYVKKMAIVGKYVEVATHDVDVIKELYRWFKDMQIPTDNYEFQALYHVEPKGLKELHQELIKDGANVRIYLPFAPTADAAKHYGFRRAEKNPEMLKIFAGKAIEYYLGKTWGK